MVQDSSAVLSADAFTFEHFKGTLIDSKEAQNRFGFSIRQLRKYRLYGSKALAGQRIFGLKILRERKSGKGPYFTWFWLENDLSRLRATLQESTPETVELVGKKWLLVSDAAKFLNLGTTTLYRWMREGCPHLHNGRRIRAARKRIAVGCSFDARTTKNAIVVLADDLTAIAGVFDADRHEYNHPRGRVISQAFAHELFGFSGVTLRRWATVGCPFLNGKKLPCVGPKLRIGGGKFGRTPLYYYFAKDLAEIQQRQTADPRNGKDDLLTIDEAAAEIGVPLSMVKNWLYQGCCWLGGKTMPLIRLKGSIGTGRSATRVFVARDVVNAITAARNRSGASVASGILNAVHKPARGESNAGNGSPSMTQRNGKPAAENGQAEIDLEALRETLPPFGSDDWVSNKQAAFLEGMTTRSFSNHRYAGTCAADGLLGSDKCGRIWRRFGTHAHPCYLRYSLLSEQDKIRKS
jgi:hypothetical protein